MMIALHLAGKTEIINMVIFLLSLGERRRERGTARAVGKLKNQGVKRSENEDKERDGRKDRSEKEKDIKTLPPCVPSLR